MKIKNILIENYKSVARISIDVKKIAGRACFILLGVNESGKSNILEAISLLDPQKKPNYLKECNKQ